MFRIKSSLERKDYQPILILIYVLLLNLDSIFFAYLSFAFAILSIILRPKFGFFLFLVLVLGSPDMEIVTTTDIVLIKNSIYTIKLGPFTIITLLSIMMFLFSFLYIPRIRINRNILIALVLPLFLPLWGFLRNDVMEAFSDSKYFFAVFGVFLIGTALNINMKQLSRVLFITLLSKMIVNILLTTSQLGFVLIYWGTATYLFPIVLLFYPKKWNKYLIIILHIVVLLNFFLFPSRSRFVFYFFTLMVYLYLNGGGFIKKFFKYFLHYSIPIILGIIVFVTILPEKTVRYFKYKINSIDIFSPENKSANLRLLEFKNIYFSAKHKVYPLFIGEGYGSYFEDKYIPFDIELLRKRGGAYPDEELDSRKFTNPHTVLNKLLLKIGFLPTIVFIIGLILISFRNKKKFDRRVYYLIYVLPILAMVMYTQKLQIVFGIILLILNTYYRCRISEVELD